MRALAGLTSALLLSACAYVPPATQTSASATSGFVVSAPDWQPVSAEPGSAKGVARLRELAKSFPDSASIRLQLLNAHFETGDIPRIVAEALWLAERGYSFRESAASKILSRAGDTAVADRLSDLLAQNSQSIEASTVAGTFPADAQLVESVIVDPVNGALYGSTVVSRFVVVAPKGGNPQGNAPLIRVESEGVDSLSGMATGHDREYLWIASSDLGMTPLGARLFRGLLRYQKAGEGTPDRFPAPEGVNLSDITVALDGSVFASDPTGGGLYRFSEGAIRPFVQPGTFRSPQGLVTSVDGAKLYVSDYRYGLAVIDLGTKKVRRLKSRVPMILDGIDGLWREGNRLIGVQNGMSPMRIVSIDLSDDGLSAIKLTVLEQAHPGWTEPLGGSIHNGALYYVATGQWDRFDKGGTVKVGKPPIPTEIRRLPL